MLVLGTIPLMFFISLSYSSYFSLKEGPSVIRCRTFHDILIDICTNDDGHLNVSFTDKFLPDGHFVFINRCIYITYLLHLMMKLPIRVAFLSKMSRIFSLIFLSFYKFSIIILE